MNKKDKARYVQKILNEYFPEPPIPLQHSDPFTLLVAVVLSARCTDARVNQITPKLFKLAKTAETFAKLDPKEVQAIIRPCGLSPQKSKNLVLLSQILVQEYGGEVPNSFEALELLPGVGHKTASVVMTQAFNVPAFPVDTHIHRLAKRWGFSTGKNVKKTEEDLKKVFSKDSWGKVHLQMIHYARAYCPARGHDIDHCPICSAIASTK